MVFTIFTLYVLTAAEAYGLFSREVRFNFNYIQKKKKITYKKKTKKKLHTKKKEFKGP
jgi:hypothetical protein